MAKINENISKQPNNINEYYVGVYAYDMSIIDDFRARFNYKKDGTPKTNNIIQITNSENVFEIIGDLENDNIQFPIISLTRTGWSIKDFHQETQTHLGALVDYIEPTDKKDDRLKQVRLQAIPIKINYQVDIWTQNRADNDILARELIWFYTLNPQLLVKIPHGLNAKHVFNVMFDFDIVDNSDIVEHNSKGRYYRQTLGLYVDDAYLWRSSVTNVPKIEDLKYSIYEGDIQSIKDKFLLESGDIKDINGGLIDE